jgi:hypothetical protein
VGDKGDLHARSSGQRANRGDNAGPVTEEDVRWLIGHLRVVVATSSAVWAGRGMTLLQLTVLHFISALSPVTLTDLAQVLGTKPPATSAIVDRLSHAGLVHRTPDTKTVDASSCPSPPPPNRSSATPIRTPPGAS